MRALLTRTLAIAVLLLSGATRANAAVIIDFTPPFGGNPDENLLFNDPSLVLTGPAIQGVTNTTATVFSIAGTESLLGNGGQARVESGDGGFTSLLFSPQDGDTWFTAFEANLNVKKPATGHANGTVTVTVTDVLGGLWLASHAVGSQGSNFFNVVVTSPHLLRSVLIETTVDLADVRQIRVGGIGSPQGSVPEPSQLALLGLGLIAAARAVRRRVAAR